MTRFLLLAIAALLGLIVIDRARSAGSPAPAPAPVALMPGPEAGPRAHSQTAAHPASPPTAAPAPVPEESGTPTIDLLARLEGRRRLAQALHYTYFDSLFTETDSVVRRWSETTAPLLVAIASGPGGAGPDPQLEAIMRRALAIWQDARLGVGLAMTRDTTTAQIVITSVEQLGGERAGLTDLEWTPNGAIHSARIFLARKDQRGHLIPESAAFGVAIHEVGHALGLAHSPNPDDVMFSATRTTRLSARDRSTLTLLYELPLGSIRESR